MKQHYNHLQPDGDPYNLGQWIETVPHAYDLTLQPEIDLTRNLIRGLFELATTYTGQELSATVNDSLSSCLYSANTVLIKLQRIQAKIESDHSFDGKERRISYTYDEPEDFDFDSLSDEEKIQRVKEILDQVRNEIRLDLANEIALVRIRTEQDMSRWRQGVEPKGAVRTARAVLSGVNTICRLFNDQLSPTNTTAGNPFSAVLPKVIAELREELGINVF